MRRIILFAMLLTAALGLSGCDLLKQAARQKESAQDTQDQSEQQIVIDTEDGIPFIETQAEDDTEAADSDLQTESDMEEDFMVVPDTETGMSEGAEETESQVQAETQIQTETEEESYPEPVNTVLAQVIAGREAMGEHWAVGYEDLATGEVCGYHDADVMQSASVVKLFIMGAVYRYMCYPPEGEEPIPFGEEYEGQLREVINSMITVSDNDAANLLVDRLGGGDFAKGAELIAEFCKENGYVGTSVGRRFLESNPTGDNYTTAADTRKFLSDLYHGKLVNEEASAKMLEIVKGQTLRNKIPSGLPEGFASGNKTGEMPEGYGLGCIENDVAIVFPPEGQGEGYILTVLSNDLAGRNSEAIEAIRQISSLTAQWYQGQQQS
ncbi:MAG: serine hydrolase [Lachnospiraceae bacterium]|nr:serine hydrolase [Lachnospiraceae bacterium]